MLDLAASALAHGRRSPKPVKEEKAPEKPKAPKSGKGRVHEIRIRRAKGGFIAKHEPEMDPDNPAAPKPDDEHVIPDLAALHNHIDQHWGDGEPAAPGHGSEE